MSCHVFFINNISRYRLYVPPGLGNCIRVPRVVHTPHSHRLILFADLYRELHFQLRCKAPKYASLTVNYAFPGVFHYCNGVQAFFELYRYLLSTSASSVLVQDIITLSTEIQIMLHLQYTCSTLSSAFSTTMTVPRFFGLIRYGCDSVPHISF